MEYIRYKLVTLYLVRYSNEILLGKRQLRFYGLYITITKSLYNV